MDLSDLDGLLIFLVTSFCSWLAYWITRENDDDDDADD